MTMFSGPFVPAFPDSKRIHRALFGVVYEEDIYETFCRAAPNVMRAFWWRVPAEMRRRNLIFVHVPRAAGTSISSALFGPRNTLHHSIRYYKTVHPRFYRDAESFAVLREPLERFASSYAFVRAGGTPSCRLSDFFVAETAHIRSVDDYLCFLEERDVLATDFVMRPQSWFVCDLETGAPLVRRLFLLNQDKARLALFLKQHGVTALPRLNASGRVPLCLSPRQKSRIEKLYLRDFELVEGLRDARAREAKDCARILAIAAE
jgi:hypothetical protein